jgi:hypothetical protein
LKDSGAVGCGDRVCRECAANGINECEHVSVGTWVLGKEDKKKAQKPSKDMNDLGYGSAELSQG